MMFVPWPENDHRHAIQSASFAAEFNGQLPTKAISEIEKLSKSMKDLGFPRMQKKQKRTIEIGPGGAVASKDDSDALTGIDFDCVKSDGSRKQVLTIQRELLIFETHDYSSWEEISRTASEAYQQVLDTVLSHVDIHVVGLKYVDRFDWDGDGGVDYGTLFRDDNKYIPSRLVRSNDLWHSHTGFFDGDTKQEQLRQLKHINVDVRRDNESGTTYANIDMTFRAIELSGFQAHNRENRAIEKLQDIWEQLHSELKHSLSELLCDEVSKKIGLQE